jgi:pilus assembly protein CpaC
MCAESSRLAATLLVATALASPAAAQSSGPHKSSAAASPPLASEEIELHVGEQTVISSEEVRSYSEGTRGIVDVRLTRDASQFVIVALKPGATSLLLLMMDGTERHLKFTVADPDADPGMASDANAVKPRDNVRLDFYFVQVSKSYSHQIGIGFPGSIAPTFNVGLDARTGALDSATAVIESQPLPRLDMAAASGWAKVMRQAAVVTANGEKAVFSGGGEINVAVQTAFTTGVQKIQFGSEIAIEPRYDSRTGRIELKVHADNSELESDRGTGIPGRATASLDTVVNLELGQSLVLAGLTAKSERSSASGLPGLSQIPVIGVLFGSHGHAEEESENVVVIIPSVVDAVSRENRERLEAALASYAEYSGDIDEVDFMPPAKTNASGAPGSAPAPARPEP